MIINISLTSGNATPDVVRALSEIKNAGGGELHFQTGEYHFYKDGTEKSFFAVSNNSANVKAMVFPIIDMENVTIDGHGSVFVFHEVVFPFMVSHSRNVTLRNITMDLGMSPLVNLKVRDIAEDGFYLDIDRKVSPFFVKNGSIFFERESENWDGSKKYISLHAIGRHQVQFLATGDCCSQKLVNLPAKLIKADAVETPDGVYIKYRPDTPSRCNFGEEMLSAIIDGGRSIDVICLDRSENVTVSNVAVARGIGMGIIGQLSRNILIDGFSTDNTRHKGHQSLTADALHFVNCDGILEIKNCRIADTMDDAINVHGMYTALTKAEKDTIYTKIMHQEQNYFNPYREGDRLVLINPQSYEIKAEFIVNSATLNAENGTDIVLKGSFSYGFEEIAEGFLVENPDRMPNLHLHSNNFDNFPHNRISGAGKMVVENNVFSNCHSALLCYDLAKYWYESGRVKHLIYRNNTLDNCNIVGSGAFLSIGISGVPNELAPKIHERIEITGNRFSRIKNLAVMAGGVKELVVEGNIFDTDKEGLILNS